MARVGLIVAFFASGAAALVFQVLWFRQLAFTLGNTVWAGSLVLASFMGGLALGFWDGTRCP
jgi:spermidine synthase